jgi:hypothetical protein
MTSFRRMISITWLCMGTACSAGGEFSSSSTTAEGAAGGSTAVSSSSSSSASAGAIGGSTSGDSSAAASSTSGASSTISGTASGSTRGDSSAAAGATSGAVASTGGAGGGAAGTTGGKGSSSGSSGATLFLGASMQGLSLAAVMPDGTDNAWQDLVGTDAVYGDVLPRAPAAVFGGTAGFTDSFQIIGDAGSTVNAIVTDDTVPSGVSNQVLQMTMRLPYDNESMQDAYLAFPDTSKAQGMLYTSRWVWLQADLASRDGSGMWMEITETKTPDPAERFQLGIVQYTPYGSTVPVFQMLHDVPGSPWAYYAQTWLSPTEAGINTGNNGIGQTHMAPVPLGRWFRAEFAFNRSDADGQGWMWFALTDPGSSDAELRAGVQVYALRGAFSFTAEGTTTTLGLNEAQPSKLINRLFMFNCYSNLVRSLSSPYVMKFTDMEVWTGGWPSTATAHPSDYN